jgi:TP901 family phage tail tape measure protein
MQGLSLGETLEDGVDLNKYSEALSKVGIDVLNAKGEMRDMDDILAELGEKWEGFGETTQVAIAQTVGGIRQYNQMIALMDNWDSVQENIERAKDATGELTKQQEIWSESYEAAAKRVEQAQANLYEKFINDKSIVKLNDIFAELINSISRVVDSMGGVLPVVLTLVGVFSKSLFPILQAGFTSLKNNIAVLTGSASRQISNMQNMI